MDKLAHFAAGGAVAAAVLPFGVWLAIFAVAAAAIGKELFDAKRGGAYDARDCAATLLGGVLMAVWLLSVDWVQVWRAM